jgi:hypothetical protein
VRVIDTGFTAREFVVNAALGIIFILSRIFPDISGSRKIRKG